MFEQLSSPSGPIGGKIVVNGTEPKDDAFISCVGSRNKQTGYEYCSRVCCMYLAKHAHQVKEQLSDANVTMCFQDSKSIWKRV